MEVSWSDPVTPETVYFNGTDANACGISAEETQERFVPRLKKAARRAVNIKKLLIQYTNEVDRTWPYTKVARIIEIFTSINGRKATLESVEEDCFGYTVTFSPTLAKKRQRDDGHDKKQPFAINIDFSRCDDRMHELCIKEYIWPYSEMP
jgi:hypothetical protein